MDLEKMVTILSKYKGIHYLKFANTLIPLYGVRFEKGHYNDLVILHGDILVSTINYNKIKSVTQEGDIILYEN